MLYMISERVCSGMYDICQGYMACKEEIDETIMVVTSSSWMVTLFGNETELTHKLLATLVVRLAPVGVILADAVLDENIHGKVITAPVAVHLECPDAQRVSKACGIYVCTEHVLPWLISRDANLRLKYFPYNT